MTSLVVDDKKANFFRLFVRHSRNETGKHHWATLTSTLIILDITKTSFNNCRFIISCRNILRKSSAMQCNAWNIASVIMENCTKWFRQFSVKLNLGGVTSIGWRRNHQKYKRRMEQPRMNWDRGRYDVQNFSAKILATKNAQAEWKEKL